MTKYWYDMYQLWKFYFIILIFQKYNPLFLVSQWWPYFSQLRVRSAMVDCRGDSDIRRIWDTTERSILLRR